jgi:integrase/recombinase XerD
MNELAHLKEENILWQERRLVVCGEGGPYGKKTKFRILPMTDRLHSLIAHHFAGHDSAGMRRPQFFS